MYSMIYDSPIGRLRLEADDAGLCFARLIGTDEQVPFCASPILEEAVRQLAQYFAGERTEFDLPLSVHGSPFDRSVWRRLQGIPFAQVRTYGQIAAQLGAEKASRAVGGACSRNPLLIIVPCHRVLAATGKLTGFAAGMQAKRMLLEHEGWTIRDDTIKMI